jgi:hypothetical protein
MGLNKDQNGCLFPHMSMDVQESLLSSEGHGPGITSQWAKVTI